jgi:hypothetical protein
VRLAPLAALGRPRAEAPRQPEQRSAGREILQRLGYLALGLALGGLQVWLCSGEVLAVREVAVYGNRLLPTAEVQSQLDVAGRQVLWLRQEELAARLRVFPEVAHAQVEVFAPGIVEVSIVERQPALLWIIDGHRWLVDEQGLVLRAATGEWPALPVVYQSAEQQWHRGHQLDPRVISDALRLGRFVDSNFEPGTRLVYHPQDGLIIVGKGWQARFDPGGDLNEQHAALRALLARTDLATDGSAIYDLRFPGRGYVRSQRAPATPASAQPRQP